MKLSDECLEWLAKAPWIFLMMVIVVPHFIGCIVLWKWFIRWAVS